MTDTTPTPPTASDALFGGTSVRVRFKDRKRPPQYAKVRMLPLSLIPEMMRALDDDAQLLALYLDWEVSDVDLLHPESVVEALAAGDEINLRPFTESRERCLNRMSRFELAISGKTMERAAKHGPSSATSSPPSALAPE